MKHFNDIVELLGYKDLVHLYYALGLSDEEIVKAKKKDDPEVIATVAVRRVFNDGWCQKDPNNATIGAVIKGLEDAKNIEAKEFFENLWINEQKRTGKIIIIMCLWCQN